MDDQNIKPIKYSFCFSSFLYNNLQNSKERTLIIDTREAQSYHKHHVKGSINLNDQRIQDYIQGKSSTLDRTKLNIGNIFEVLTTDENKKFAKRRRCYCFFVMNENPLPRNFLTEMKRLTEFDDHEDSFQVSDTKIQSLLQRTLEDAEERDSISNALEIFKIMQKDKVREMFIVLDDGSSFFNRYHYISNSLNDQKSLIVHDTPCHSDGTFPHDILEGKLFLGSFLQSGNYDLVSNLKITHILNITDECENVHEDKGIKYLKLSILDEPDKNILAFFQQAYDFIVEALQEGHARILVHCAMGKSRSATIVIMYLMKKFGWTLEKALNFVKRKREIVNPNEGFIVQLQDFERNGLCFH